MEDNPLRWLSFSGDIEYEVLQAQEEGKDVDSLSQKLQAIRQEESPDKKESMAAALMDEIRIAPVRADFPFDEPGQMEDIRKARKGYEIYDAPVVYQKDELLQDKIYGAWLARCAGCLLGQPVENWYSERIVGLLQETGNIPLRKYISSDIAEELRKRYNIVDEGRVYGGNTINWINNVSCGPEDDDTNYTVFSLKLLKRFGKGFTTREVAQGWLLEMQPLRQCTAERVTVRNLLNGIPAEQAAIYRNPYREWLGAHIRSDLYGYINPGNPKAAAEMAYQDARLSHVKNAVYAAMYLAAMIAYAAVCSDEIQIIQAGLSQIPAGSRLYAQLSRVLQMYLEGRSVEETHHMISSAYQERVQHDWCHSISNMMIITTAFLYCGRDFDKLFEYSIRIGFDTDCNAANAGSVLGIMLGAEQLPRQWREPLNDTLKSCIEDYNQVRISQLAEETFSWIS